MAHRDTSPTPSAGSLRREVVFVSKGNPTMQVQAGQTGQVSVSNTGHRAQPSKAPTGAEAATSLLTLKLAQVNAERRRLKDEAMRLRTALGKPAESESESESESDGDCDEGERSLSTASTMVADYGKPLGEIQKRWFSGFPGDPTRPVQSMLKNLALICCHMSRVLSYLSLSEDSMASAAEQRLLGQVYGPRVVKQRLLLDLLVWRRSALMVLLISTFGVTALAVRLDIYIASEDIAAMRANTNVAMNHTSWSLRASDVHCEMESDSWTSLLPCEPDRNTVEALDFGEFTRSVIKSVLYKLGIEVLFAQLLLSIVFIFLKCAACFFVLKATLNWSKYRVSSWHLSMAWLMMFCTPFVRSCVPTSGLINWQPVTADLDRYLLVADLRFDIVRHVEELLVQLQTGCSSDKVEHLTGKVHEEIRFGCKGVDRLHHLFFWSTRLKTAHDICVNAIEFMDSPAQDALAHKQQLCESLQDDIWLKQDISLSAVGEVVDTTWFQHALYGLIGFGYSIMSFPLVFTKALSLAPGLLMSAIKIKLVVPQSYLAGVCIIVMPIIFVPLILSLSIFVVQCLGDIWLWLAVNLFILSSLSFTLLGVHWRVNEPMTRDQVLLFTDKVLWVVRMVRSASLCFLMIYTIRLGLLLHEAMKSHEGIASFLMEKLHMHVVPFLMEHMKLDWALNAFLDVLEPVSYLAFSFWTGMYMTAVMGADWLLEASAEEWYLSNRGKLHESKRDKQRAIMLAVCEVTELKERYAARYASDKKQAAKAAKAADSGHSSDSSGDTTTGFCKCFTP